MKKLIMASITAVVVIVVLAGTLIPVLDDATATTDTFNNTGYYYMTDTTTEHTYVFDGTKWTIDGEVLDHTLAGVNIIATDTFFIRDVGQVRGGYNISMTACNLTVGDGVITGTYDTSGTTGNAASWSFSTFYGATTEESDCVMTDRNNTPIAYVLGDSDIYGYGLTILTSGNQVTFKVTGNYDDGATVECSLGDVVISDIEFNATPVSGYEDLYIFESVTFVATYNNTTTNVTYNILVAPSEVTAERSVHFTDGENAILNAIPAIVIIALLLGVVALVLRSRMD